ncbi:hypothetical protein LOAG_03404 [Loa loa]|uniref:Uncharacterized protein n=1 Tax=Loa loa TaxID=7209 RepID=A0A1S0U4H3_LOALO|nr:hypothetical protein LOAG_03404 [Loa loa]EFO25082.1 hypothetical protein LOAG_03404 [Loa loa]
MRCLPFKQCTCFTACQLYKNFTTEEGDVRPKETHILLLFERLISFLSMQMAKCRSVCKALSKGLKGHRSTSEQMMRHTTASHTDRFFNVTNKKLCITFRILKTESYSLHPYCTCQLKFVEVSCEDTSKRVSVGNAEKPKFFGKTKNNGRN